MNWDDTDVRRMEFQRYIEKSGVMESISRVLAALYELPEKPLDTNEFIRDFLSVSSPENVEQLRHTLTTLQARLNLVDDEIDKALKEQEFLVNKIRQKQREARGEPEPDPIPQSSLSTAQNITAVAEQLTDLASLDEDLHRTPLATTIEEEEEELLDDELDPTQTYHYDNDD
eukprot:UN03905